MRLRYIFVILLIFPGLGACQGLPPVRLQLGGLQGSENVEVVPAPPRPEMQVVTSDHEAGAVAREVLQAQGTAADVAAAVGFTLAVTSPASAGLGAGGVCVTRDADGRLEAVDFRTARLPRGLLALHAKFGNRPWSSLVVSAETLARFGFSVSPALARDLETYGQALVGDKVALASFMTPARRLIAAGDEWRQPWLSDTLARMRTPRFLEGSPPRWYVPAVTGKTAVLEPGTTGFAVADAHGAAVACVISMGRPFGLGQMTRASGYLFAATSPQDEILDQLALGFLACIKGTGEAEEGAPRCPAPSAAFGLLP
ncbi:MAG: gamma-glutamyltransferase [Rhodospirillaceae bacterium]